VKNLNISQQNLNIFMNILGFDSLLETSYGKTSVSANSLLTGIRIRHEENWYIVGSACGNLGRNPHRLVNASPQEKDYTILLLSALLLAGKTQTEKINLTLGFPFSSFNTHQLQAEKFLSQKHFSIEYDTSLYIRDGKIEKKIIEIDTFDCIPELTACVIGLKKEYNVTENNFLVVSLGFGTTEIGIVTEEGLNKRTTISVPGIIRCIQNFRDELEREYFIGFMTDNQLDKAFRKGNLVINRKLVNIQKIRKDILLAFYKEYVSDTIRSQVSDRDFEKLEKIYICGGGANYTELMESFDNEFGKMLKVEKISESDTLAAVGYYHNSQRIALNSDSENVGIDLGNSSTYICFNT
jgi:hypothetical protein